jgi:thiol:disulfide interchange protein
MDKIMADFDDIFPKRDSVLYNTSKSYQDEVDRQDNIDREKTAIRLQFDLTKRLQDLEATLQKQREIDRLERAKEKEIEYIQRQDERHSDRWFTAKAIVIAALLGGLVVKLLDIFFK